MRSQRIEGLLRRTVLLVLVVIAQRYVAPLMPLWVVLPWFLLGVGISTITYKPNGRGTLHGVISIGTYAAIGFSVFLGGLAIQLLGNDLGKGLFTFVAFLPYNVLIPAALVIPMIALDLAAMNSERVAGAIGPLCILLVVPLFWSQGDFQTDLLPHPIWYPVAAATILISLLGYQWAFSLRRGGERSWRGIKQIFLVVLPIILLIAGAGYRIWSSGATEAGGGLMRPSLFHFDFSDYIRLESKISMSRELVLLYREDSMPPDRLIRRFVLDGYDENRGFFRTDVQAADQDRLNPTDVHAPADPARSVTQEYYLLNLDPEALLLVPEAVAVAELPRWENSSFSRAYRVVSRRPDISNASLTAIPDFAGEAWSDAPVVGSESVPSTIGELAGEITAGLNDPYDSVRAIEAYLQNEYYYSLTPGVATDGDQLNHFLFQSRKGYCSYFAFSMALMVRSLGIPARVAVGFFVDPTASMIGFYPIRADMAHAWVEVWFPEIGWIEFDPTSRRVAPGEEIAFDIGLDYDRIGALVEEILQREGDTTIEAPTAEDSPIAASATRSKGIVIGAVLALFGALFAIWYLLRLRWCGKLAGDPRGTIEELYRRGGKYIGRTHRLGLTYGGTAPPPSERGPQSSLTAPQLSDPPLDAVGIYLDRARYAEAFTPSDALTAYRAFRRGFRRVPARTRAEDRTYPVRLVLWWFGVYLPSRWPGACTTGRKGRPGLLLFTVLTAVALGILGPDLSAQEWSDEFTVPQEPGEGESAEELLGRIDTAIAAESYATALDWIVEGQQRFPEDYRFFRQAGDLYYREGLFDSARNAWEDALEVGGPAYPLHYDISRAYARSNRNTPAIDILRELHEEDPSDLLVTDDLAWLYYKENRLPEAQRLLENALDRYGPDRDLSMTLGTVYAGRFSYDRAVEEYETAITDALRSDDRYYLAVAYYNLSILHARFYRWEDATTSAERSMEMLERSSAYMIRAELERLRLDLNQMVASLERAVALEEEGTLASLSLADAYIAIGQPDRAIAIVTELMDREHDGWLYYYGTDPERYLQDLYATVADAFEAGANRDAVYRPGTFWDRVGIAFRGVSRRIRQWYYRGLYRRQTIRVAHRFDEGGRPILAAWNRMTASDWFPPLAVRYLDRAEQLELAVNPRAATDYRLVRAEIKKNAELYSTLADTLSGAWQRESLLSAYLGIYTNSRASSERGVDAAAEAWLLHPNAFATRRVRIPIDIRADRHIRRRLSRLAIKHVEMSPLVLNIESETDYILWNIHDRRTGQDLRGGRVMTGDGLGIALQSLVDQLTAVR